MSDEDDFIIRESRADKPIGYPPNFIIRKALENLYTSIVGALDVGDFETLLKEVADLTYDEAKEKLITQYGTPKELSKARLKAKSIEAEEKLEQAEQEALAEQRTLEEEFAEIEGVARRTLAENLELFRRNQELQKEVKRLKEELEKKPVLPAPPTPVVPIVAPAVPPAHGSMYNEFKGRINQAVTLPDIDEVVAEIYDIAQHEEYDQLTRPDISELIALARDTYERRSMKLAEMRLPEKKIKKPAKPGEKPAVEETRIKREEAPVFFGALPPGVMYRYSRPDRETAVFQDIPFVRDYELERTIIRNGLLLFPPQWYALPPEEKHNRYGWTLASAFRHAVEYLHKFSWTDLERDYGIPKEYIDAWRESK